MVQVVHAPDQHPSISFYEASEQEFKLPFGKSGN